MKLPVIKKLAVLILVPLAFTVLGYILLFFAAKPVVNPIVNVWSMMATDTPTQEEDEGYTDLYSGAIFSTYTDTVPSSTITFPLPGTLYGEISIEGTELNCSLFFGDTNKALRKGAGQYAGSSFPGTGSTVLIAGHNNRYFDTLKDAKIGSIITLKTHYGEYKYRITGTAVKKATDKSAYDLGADHENIVLYTCYPFNALGLTSQRYFVYGEYVSGPRVLMDQ